MSEYIVLLHPGHNRVYFNATKKLAISELKVALINMDITANKIEIRDIGEGSYLVFDTARALETYELEKIAGLSFVYVMFENKGGENWLLQPIITPNNKYLQDNISTILKYTGKTNELFTRMMLNVATLTAGVSGGVRLLDPIAGKGTTLYEGMINGYNVYGVEIGDKPVAEAYAYVKKYLVTERLKHEGDHERISGANKSFRAKKYFITYAKDKEEYKYNPKRFEMVAGDSRYCDQYFKKNYFDVIVGDLPYGVQHSSVTNENQSSFTRNPLELIKACAKSWYNVLREGGVLVLAWNKLVLEKDKFSEALEKVGFEVLKGGVYEEFEHRVDNSILRDIIVAKKVL